MEDRFKFRGLKFFDERVAKINEHSEWVYGCLYMNESEAYIWNPDTEMQISVLKRTIGQCTGFKDKSGKLIYEGDRYIYRNGILRPRHIRQLLREKHKENYIVNELTIAHWIVDMDIMNSPLDRVLVIGNKYQIPNG